MYASSVNNGCYDSEIFSIIANGLISALRLKSKWNDGKFQQLRWLEKHLKKLSNYESSVKCKKINVREKKFLLKVSSKGSVF